MEEKNQNIEEKKDLTQEEIEEVQGGSNFNPPHEEADELELRCPKCGKYVT